MNEVKKMQPHCQEGNNNLRLQYCSQKLYGYYTLSKNLPRRSSLHRKRKLDCLSEKFVLLEMNNGYTSHWGDFIHRVNFRIQVNYHGYTEARDGWSISEAYYG